MAKFKLNNEFKPAGDQPEAINRLVEGLNKGKKFQTFCVFPVTRELDA